jgi:archaeosortase C (PEF-CTERM variant)
MRFSEVEAFLRRHRTVSVLAGLLLVFTGVDLLFNPPKGQLIELFGIPFLAAGLSVLALVFRRGDAFVAGEVRRTLGSRLIDRLTLRRRIVPFLPAAAIAIIAMDLAYNLLVFGGLSIGTEDTAVLLFAAAMFAYPLVPADFGRERDFVLLFMGVFIAILVVPLLLARVYYQDLERSVDIYSWTALAPQTAWTLNLLGVPARAEAFPWTTAPGVTFVTQGGVQLTVIITTACSGIYSFGIFASAFVAFVLTEYERLEPRVFVLLGLGFVTAYVANILRMVMIVLFGVYSATPEASLQNMLVAHSNLGWVIFLGWITLFWAIVFRFFVRRPGPAPKPEPRKRGVLCGICEDVLTRALPGYRCECGKFYHVACAATVEECPRCRRRMPRGASPAPGS